MVFLLCLFHDLGYKYEYYNSLNNNIKKFDGIKNDNLYEAMVSGDVTTVNKKKFIITPNGNVHKITD